MRIALLSVILLLAGCAGDQGTATWEEVGRDMQRQGEILNTPRPATCTPQGRAAGYCQ
jgi:hypothetical protein